MLSLSTQFVLNAVVFPSMKFPMHIFEPRYRLMLRRCLEGDKRFGLVSCRKAPDGRWVPADVGCILQITEHQGYGFLLLHLYLIQSCVCVCVFTHVVVLCVYLSNSLFYMNLLSLPDGRSYIDCVGTRRFRVLDKWEQDGYLCGKIEYFDDAPLESDEKVYSYTFLLCAGMSRLCCLCGHVCLSLCG